MRATVIALLVTALPAVGHTAFRFERGVVPAGAGVYRLNVDLPLLSGSAPDLRDFRLFGASGNEIAYLISEPRTSLPRWLGGSVLDTVPTKRSSGFEVDLGSLEHVDALRFENIPPPFLKHVTVEGSGDRTRWSLLADTTLFDLPSDNLRRRDVEFPPGRFRYLRVTWDDRSSARVGRAAVRARVHGTSAPPVPVRASVPFRVRSSERGRTRIRVALPARSLPVTAVEIRAGSGDVFREASVTEPRLAGGQIIPTALGTATLRQASRNGMVASNMIIPISQPQSRELEIAIDDGDNDPLAIDQIVLRLAPQPSILFESPDGAPLTARYGDESLTAPVYDLQAAREMLARTEVQSARWSDSVKRTVAEPAPAPLRLEGAPVDRKRFRFSRHVAPARAGLTVLPLDADVLARSRDLADVRLVDRTGRQVPYVVERRASPVVVLLQIRRHMEADRNVSVYQFATPYPAMPEAAKLFVTTSARVFSRNVELRIGEDARRGREAQTLAATTWQSVDADENAPPLMFDLPANVESVELSIDEGDNAPLPITSAEVHLPSYALRFYSPGSRLDLLYGSATASAPRYDLALLTPRLFTEAAQEIGFISPPPMRVPAEASGERKFFWIAIGVVAVLLLVLVARLLAPLVREEPGTLG